MTNKKVEYIINENCAIAVILRNWLEVDYSKSLHERLVNKLPWIQGQITLFGKTVDIPRKLFFVGGDNVKVYKYSNLSFPIESWNQDKAEYQEIKQMCELIKTDKQIQEITKSLVGSQTQTELQFDSCLLNFYRDGTDKIDPHSDKEALGVLNAVATVSLGDSRKMVFKSKKKDEKGNYVKVETVLNGSDLMLMLGNCQELWTHGIPRCISKSSRISLTFRLINR